MNHTNNHDQHRLFFALASCLCIVTMPTACDQGQDHELEASEQLMGADDETLTAAADHALSWDGVLLPAAVGESLTLGEVEFAAQQQTQQQGQGPKLETFMYSSTDGVIAITSAPGGLFAPFPEHIPLLEEEQINSGFLGAVKFYDENDELVGFGAEQEDQDFDTASAITTQAITIPGRGTLMLAEVDDFSAVLTEVGDMVASQDLIRTYDPPWVVQTTVDGTGRVVGGTGEFEGAHGIVRKFTALHELNLIDQFVDVNGIIQVLYW